MMTRFPPPHLLVALGMLVLVACGGRAEAPTPGVTATLTPTATATPSLIQQHSIPPSLTPTPAPTRMALAGTTATAPAPTRIAVAGTTATARTPTGNSSPAVADSTALMEAALGWLTSRGEFDDSFIRRMGESGDASFVPVLVDILFFRFVTPRTTMDPIRSALTELTGENFADSSWHDWFIWLGRHQEVEAPPRYAEWKSKLFNRIDPRISMFFYDGVKARIRLEEIVWGGVAKDGIPDLNDAPVIPASQATFLNPDDRVFGVSINGEHRAYPLRILNPHEMANDVVGGEPIALAY